MEDTTYDLSPRARRRQHRPSWLRPDHRWHKVYDKALPQDEASLRAVFDEIKIYGTVLLIVDQ